MKAVILAAGLGSRLGNFSITPKCLIEIGGKTLLERQIDILKSCGIEGEDISVVIGKQGETWSEKNRLRIIELSKRAKILVNEKNAEFNQCYSFWLALQESKDDGLVCLDGDSFFTEALLRKVVGSHFDSLISTRKALPKEKRKRVLTEGNKINGIGNEMDSERVYVPVLKLGITVCNALAEEIASGRYFNLAIDSPLNAVCKSHEINYLDIPDGESFLNINTPEEYNLAKSLIFSP